MTTKRTKDDLTRENAYLRERVAWLEAHVSSLNASLAQALSKLAPEAPSPMTLPMPCQRGKGAICGCPACMGTVPLGTFCAHEYPSPWFGIYPPPCKKCGQGAPDTTKVTWKAYASNGTACADYGATVTTNDSVAHRIDTAGCAPQYGSVGSVWQ